MKKTILFITSVLFFALPTLSQKPLQQEDNADAAALININHHPNPDNGVQPSGKSSVQGAQLKVLPNNWQFGQKRKGSYSRALFRIVNAGNDTLVIFSITEQLNGFQLSDTLQFPIPIASGDTLAFDAWFFPQEAIDYSGSIMISSNDTSQVSVPVGLSGTGIDIVNTPGALLWSTNLYGLNGWGLLKAIVPVQDVNGDSIEELVISFDDGNTYCFNGNADPTPEILWHIRPKIAGWHEGPLTPVAIPDINNDGYGDLIDGRHEKVVAVSGKSGKDLWVKGVVERVMQVNVKYDFNGDGFPDVLCTTGNNPAPVFYNGRVACLNGKTGTLLWNRIFHRNFDGVIGIEDFTGDGNPDVAVGSRYPFSSLIGFDGMNGSVHWDNVNMEGWGWKSLVQIADINDDGIKDFAASGIFGSLIYCSATTGQILCQEKLDQPGAVLLNPLDDVNRDGMVEMILSGYQSGAILVSGSSCHNFVWALPFPGTFYAVNAGDINKDTIQDIFAGASRDSTLNHAYFINGINGKAIDSVPLPDITTAIAAIQDMNDDGVKEMVVGGRRFLYCLSGGHQKNPEATEDPDDSISTPRMLSVYPNPSTGLVKITLELRHQSRIKVNLYSSAGILVETILNTELSPGLHVRTWNGSSLAPGLYIVELKSTRGYERQKLILSQDIEAPR